MTARKASKSIVSGSPTDGEPEYLVVGSLRRPHGLRGEMVMEVHTDFPERLGPGTGVYVGESHRPMTIDGTRFHNEGLLIKFGGVDTPEEAGRHRNQFVYVTAADRPPLPEGRYYHHKLIGFAVVDEAGGAIGTLTEILQTGANDVFVVARPGAGEALLPNIPSVILGIEADRRLMRVRLIPGLLDDSGE
jgi:16S rRNA processing protein RimM